MGLCRHMSGNGASRHERISLEAVLGIQMSTSRWVRVTVVVVVSRG